MEAAEAYRSGKSAVIGLVRDADPDVRVPSCPSWTVKDLLAHLVGLAEDVATGNVDGYATEPWTADQVGRGADRSVDELIEAWDPWTDRLIALFPDLPGAIHSAVVVDIVEHEQDLHEALRQSDTARHGRVEVALASLIGGLRGVHARSGLPAYRIEATDWRSWNIGTDEPAGALRAHSNLLLRALAGRRPRTEVAAMDWTMDPEPFLDHFLFPTFHWPGHRGLRPDGEA